LALGSWRLIFVVMAGLALVMLACSLWGLAETRSDDAARRARASHPLVTYVRLLGNTRITGLLLSAAFNNAAFFTYVAAAPLLLIQIHGLKPLAFSIIFAANAAGLIGASQVNRLLLRRISAPRMLALSIAPAVAIGAGFLILAILHWDALPALLALIFLTIASTCVVQANTTACALSLEPASAGSIVALFGATAFAAGTLGSMVASALFDGTSAGVILVIGVSLLANAVTLKYLALRREGA